MSPRPILKQSVRPPPSLHTPLAVHFPPSPSLTTHTFTTHSPAAYDRSPIAVSPNSCALPERGCPGRTYMLDESATQPKRGHPYGGRDLHPRALALNAARQQQQQEEDDAGRSLLPPLIPDLSSESDESDGFTSPPLESFSHSSSSSYMFGLAIPQDKYAAFTSVDIDMYGANSISPPSALSFLPHPPSLSSRSSYHHELSPFDDPMQNKPKRRRERKHDSSRVPDRIPNGLGDVPDSPTRSRSFSSSLAARHAASCFRLEDDGCLGGF